MNALIVIALIGTFCVAMLATAALMPPVQRWCVRRGWVAYPGGRRLHARPTPTIGGIAIYFGFMATFALTFALTQFAPLQRSAFETTRLLLVMLGGTLIFGVMWLDDVRELPALPKLVASIVAALVAVGPFLWDHTLYPDVLGMPTEARGIILTAFNVPFVSQINLYDISPWLAIGATIFWIISVSNMMNLTDGLDGLAGGVSLIAALMLALHALRLPLPQYTIALLPLALAGACAGFLLFNFPPASVFMGDSGAYFLGYMLGVSAIIGGAKLATVLLVLGVPILDVAWLIISRLREGHSVAHAGRDHLHFRLRDMGFSPRQIVFFYYALSASFGTLGIAGTDRTVKLFALLLLGVIVAAVLFYATKHAARRNEQHPTGDLKP